MTRPEKDVALIEELMSFAGTRHSSVIAKRAGIDPGTLQKKLVGQDHNRLSQRTIEKLQAAFPNFPGWQRLGDHRLEYRQLGSDTDFAREVLGDTPTDVFEIPMLELAYGMGGTFLENVDPGMKMETFPRAFVRRFTNAPAEQLAWSYGIGDSMEPTIGDRDVFLIDRSKDTIRIDDQIWVLASGGIGMVKRVRAVSGSITLISDNPNVSDYKVGDEELTIIGRVAGVMKKL